MHSLQGYRCQVKHHFPKQLPGAISSVVSLYQRQFLWKSLLDSHLIKYVGEQGKIVMGSGGSLPIVRSEFMVKSEH